MKVKAEFEDGECAVTLTPENEWEQKLLGAIAKGGTKLEGYATYKPDGHYSYGKAACVQVRLEAPKDEKYDSFGAQLTCANRVTAGAA